MSDTPRTDKYGGTWASTPSNGVTIYEHARNLERKGDQLAKQCVKNVDEIGQLRAALEAETKRRLGAEACLKSWKDDEGADAARLDWLLSENMAHKRGMCIVSRDDEWVWDRKTIDAAMEAQNDDV